MSLGIFLKNIIDCFKNYNKNENTPVAQEFKNEDTSIWTRNFFNRAEYNEASIFNNWNSFGVDFYESSFEKTGDKGKDSETKTSTNSTGDAKPEGIKKSVVKAPIMQPAKKKTTNAKKQTKQKQVRTPEQELAYQNMLKQSAKASAHVKEMWEKKDRENNIFLK